MEPLNQESSRQSVGGGATVEPTQRRPANALASRRKKNARMKVVRRLHMYFGLALMPVILLYGITAILFNHPAIFGRGDVSPIEPYQFVQPDAATASELAGAVLAALQEATESDTQLAIEDGATLVGDYIIDATSDEERTRFRFTADGRRGTRTVTPVTQRIESPLPARVDPPLADVSGAMIAAVNADAGTDSVRVRAAPDVEMRVLVDGEPWIVLCDVVTGSVSARPAGEPRRAIDLRSFLLRLHVSHGYPLSMSARSVWAVVVDVTASLMIFWALSGLMMWWQMRPTRRSGAVLMAVGVVLAGVLGFAMLRLLYY